MELSQLRSFLQIVRDGSMTAAAEALCLTQPAITQQVQALEREVGGSLFERTGRGMRLTHAGEMLLPYVNRSLALLEEGKQVMADIAGGQSGRLTLGAGVTTSIFHLPRWLQQFQERRPAVEIVVRTGTSREIAALCRERQIDLGLVTSLPDGSELAHEPLLGEEIVLALPGLTPPGQRRLTRERLVELPLILFPPGTGFRDYLDEALGRAGIRPRVKMESDSLEAIKSFVALGLGASLLPEAAVAPEIASGALVCADAPDLPPLRRTTSVIYRQDRYLTAATREFLAVIQPRGA
jgi:DNA-binding transcriptional LysR family regulator